MPQTNYDATTGDSFQINTDQGGPVLKDEGGLLAIRDEADSAYVRLRAGNAVDGADVVNKNTHPRIRQLIHFIDSGPAEGFATGAFLEILPSGDPFPTSEIWWESASKLEKIVELTTTYNANKTINTETWKVYDTDGTTLLATVTDTYAYSGVFVTSVTRAIT